jgi:hypothetical protein
MFALCALDSLRDLVGVLDRYRWIDIDCDIAVNTMAKPARTDIANAEYSRDVHWRVFDLRENFRLYAVNETRPNGKRCVFDNEENCNGDRDTDDRVENRKSKINAQYADQNREASESIDPGVKATKEPILFLPPPLLPALRRIIFLRVRTRNRNAMRRSSNLVCQCNSKIVHPQLGQRNLPIGNRLPQSNPSGVLKRCVVESDQAGPVPRERPSRSL